MAAGVIRALTLVLALFANLSLQLSEQRGVDNLAEQEHHEKSTFKTVTVPRKTEEEKPTETHDHHETTHEVPHYHYSETREEIPTHKVPHYHYTETREEIPTHTHEVPHYHYTETREEIPTHTHEVPHYHYSETKEEVPTHTHEAPHHDTKTREEPPPHTTS
jgi:hypothetical protein